MNQSKNRRRNNKPDKKVRRENHPIKIFWGEEQFSDTYCAFSAILTARFMTDYSPMPSLFYVLQNKHMNTSAATLLPYSLKIVWDFMKPS